MAQCSWTGCPGANEGVESEFQCSRCKTAAYCSRYCQLQDWSGQHETVCTAVIAPYPLEGMIAVPVDPAKRSLAQRDVLHGGVVTGVSGKQTRLAPRTPGLAESGSELTTVIALLTKRDDQSLTMFFTGVSQTVQGVRKSALAARGASAERLERVLRAWFALNQPEAPPTLSLADMQSFWQRKRAETPMGTDTPADQEIIYLIQKDTALMSVVRACNLLMGPPVRRSAWTNTALAAAVRAAKENGGDDDGDAAMYAGLDDMDIERAPGICLNGSAPKPPLVRRARDEWMSALAADLADFRDNVVGMDTVKSGIGAFVLKLMLFQRRTGFVNFGVFGNPGTGKTEVASRLGSIMYRLGYAPVKTTSGAGRAFVKYTKADFVAPFEGQSSHLTRIALLRSMGTVAVIDEAYSLLSSRDDGFGREALAQVVNDLDEYQGLMTVALLGYENRVRETLFAANPGLMRRISDIWVIPNLTGDEIFRVLLQQMTGPEGMTLPAAMTPGAYTDTRDIVDALWHAGAFADSNAGAVSSIIEAYRSVYARVAYTGGKAELIEARDLINFPALEEALVAFAARAGFRVYEAPGMAQSDVPEFEKTPAPRDGGTEKEETGDESDGGSMMRTPAAAATRTARSRRRG